jgi:hypothetical protein
MKMYRIETTDPITGNTLTQLMDIPFVIEDVKIEDAKEDTLVIYFESRVNRDLYPMALTQAQPHNIRSSREKADDWGDFLRSKPQAAKPPRHSRKITPIIRP